MPNQSREDFAKSVLKETSEPVEVSTSEEVCFATLSLARQSTRTLDIVSRDLDWRVYDTPEFIEAVKQMVLNSRHARVRILIQDAGPMVSRGHRMLELSRRLSTFIDIRVPGREHAHYNYACLVADGGGTVYQSLADRYDATVNFHDPAGASDLIREFDEKWETAQPDPNLRRLGI